jgi:hypothetical protein
MRADQHLAARLTVPYVAQAFPTLAGGGPEKVEPRRVGPACAGFYPLIAQ